MKKVKTILAISVSVLAVAIVCIIVFTRFSSTKSNSGDNNETTALVDATVFDKVKKAEDIDDSESEDGFSVGEIIKYGSYPQSEVTDKKTLSALNAKVTEKDWQSYGYYSGTGEATSDWWLCFGGHNTHYASVVGYGGDSNGNCSAENTSTGVVPAFKNPKLTSSAHRGDIVTYGSYPQSEITDTKTLSALNSQHLNWQSYSYYSGTGEKDDGKMVPSDYMRYADTEYNGEKYRAVIFDNFRPMSTWSTSEYNIQRSYGYETNTVYWFKFMPLKWRVLDPKSGLVMCTAVIDSQAFNNYVLFVDTGDEFCYYGDAEKTYAANDYMHSSIRAWLNNDFADTAFTPDEKSAIPETAIDDISSEHGTGYLDSVDTTDQIFILSYEEAINPDYGFSTTGGDDIAKQLKPSDYAKCQGVTSGDRGSDYYNGEMLPSDYMYYADIDYNGNKYRGVRFSQYRPTSTDFNSSNSNTNQIDNGYKTGNIYWFKYEPLEWRVLDPATGFVMCDSIVDSQAYNNYILFADDEFWGNSGKNYYANNYAESSIRLWLNDDFYNTAFSDEQKSNIKKTNLNNDGLGTLVGDSEYKILDAPSTDDKIFLLTSEDTEYGFDSALRCSDYAKCQGLYVCNSSDSVYNGHSYLWFRTPGLSSCSVCYVFAGQNYYRDDNAYNTGVGVVPAMKLQKLVSED